jgi:hypothetical protein
LHVNQFNLVASPVRTLFVDGPPAKNFKPWSHVPNGIALDSGVNPAAPGPRRPEHELTFASGACKKQ